MARPKKQKVEVAETAETSPIIEEDTAGTGARQVSPALSNSLPAPDASPGRAQRDKAVDDYIVRKKVREALEETAQDAREKLKLAERLDLRPRNGGGRRPRTIVVSASCGSRSGCPAASMRRSLS